MPFADRRGGVAPLPEQRGDGEAAGPDQGRVEAVQHPAFQPRPPAVTSREQAIAGGRADGRGRVRVGEPHAFSRQAVDVRRGNLGLRVVAGDIAVAEIVGKDKNDVWRTRLLWAIGAGQRAE